MYTFEDHMCDYTINASLPRFQKIDIFRTDDNVNRSVLSEPFIHTWKINTQYLNKTILHHCRGNDITLTDKVRHKSILRLIVDFFRCSDLLDIPLIHDHDRIRHGKCLFLIMCYIQKGDPQLIFETDQLILHILSKLQVQRTERLIQKQYLRLIYDCTCDCNTLLLSTTQRIRHAFLKTIQIHKLQCIFDLVINILFAFILYL